jgi:hypothetical protein
MARKRWNAATGLEEYVDGVTTHQDGTVHVPALKVGEEFGNHLLIDSEGVMRSMSNATMWDDSMVPANAFRNGVTALTFSALTTNLYGYQIDSGDILHLSVQLPHSMKAGSSIYPHIHLVNKNAIGNTAYNVAFKLTYIWAKIGGVFAGEQSEAEVRCSFQNASALTHKVMNFAAITPAAAQDGISSIFMCAVERIASSVENYATADIYTLGFDLHFEKDTLGSREPATK